MGPLGRGVLANDTDPDNDALTAVLVTGPAHGSLALNSNGSFIYTAPDPLHNDCFFGPDTFTYKANDGQVNSNVATVTINVAKLLEPPLLPLNDSYSVNENSFLSVAAPGVLANDVVLDCLPLSVAEVSGLVGNVGRATATAHGTVTVTANGGLIYVPTTLYFGPDSFTYRITDGVVGSNLATVTITVGHVNQPPVASNDSYSVNENTALNVPAPGVIINDTDPDLDPLSVRSSDVTQPTYGTVTVNGSGGFTYTPAAYYFNADGSGNPLTPPVPADSFTYRLFDGSLVSNVATVTLTVRHVNQPPVANNDSFSFGGCQPQPQTLIVAPPGVLANDTDVDADSLTASVVEGPKYGAIGLNSGGGFTYTPPAFFFGADSFTYRASDGQITSNLATVALTHTAVNCAPQAVNDIYLGAEDAPLTIAAPGVLANDVDVDGDLLSISGGTVTQPAHGTLTISPNGGFTYTPAANFRGTDTFTYKASDGSLSSNTATVAINIFCPNSPPVAANDSSTTLEDTTLTIPAPGVLTNDTDVDGDSLTATLVAGPAHGTLSFQPDGSFSYKPAPNYNGSDSFTYQNNVTGPCSSSNFATVTITVTPVEDPPVANADAYGVVALLGRTLNVSAEFGVLANDTDVDGDTLHAVIVSAPANGTLSLSPDGSFAYKPDVCFMGLDSFTYKANDGQLDSNVATVLINAIPPPSVHLSDALDDSYTLTEDHSLVVAAPGVLANDTDDNGNPLIALLMDGPAHGTLTLNADGSFTYVPAADYNGLDSFIYQVSDGGATCLPGSTATVTLSIVPVNDPPSFVKGPDQSVTDESPAQVIPHWATAISAGPPDEAGQKLTFQVDADNKTLFAAGPAIDSSGRLTFTPEPNASGTAVVTVVLKDDGGTDNGGVDSSSPQTFTITVEKPFLLHNTNRPLDVDNDGHVSSIDALLIINVLNHPPELTPQAKAATAAQTLYLDTSRDNHVSSIDALLVINAINNGLGGEGEGDSGDTAGALDWSDTLALLAADSAAQGRRRRGV